MNDKMTEKQAPSVYVVVQKPSHGSGSKDEEEYLSKDEEEYLAKKCPRKTMLVLACLQLSACGLAAITQVLLQKKLNFFKNCTQNSPFVNRFSPETIII
jgi:hypothetical protein